MSTFKLHVHHFTRCYQVTEFAGRDTALNAAAQARAQLEKQAGRETFRRSLPGQPGAYQWGGEDWGVSLEVCR